MRLPKRITVCGVDMPVKRIRGSRSSAHIGVPIIRVGTNMNDHFVGESFLHEVLETLLEHRNVRYRMGRDHPEEEKIMFVFNHAQLNLIAADLYTALKPLLKLK